MKVDQALLEQIILEETKATLKERSWLDPFGFKDEDPAADRRAAAQAAKKVWDRKKSPLPQQAYDSPGAIPRITKALSMPEEGRKVNALAIAWPNYRFPNPNWATASGQASGGHEDYPEDCLKPRGERPEGLKCPKKPKTAIALGHAGIVLIGDDGAATYFDFGLYVSRGQPHQDPRSKAYGKPRRKLAGDKEHVYPRAERSAKYKQNIGLVRGPWRFTHLSKEKALWNEDGSLKNQPQFLTAIRSASWFKNYRKGSPMKTALIRGIDYEKAYAYANSEVGRMQPYNLFVHGMGANCATFVADVLEAGDAGGAILSMRKQLMATPAAIVDYAANDSDEEIVFV